MTRLSWQIRTGILLVSVSAILYVVHFFIFQNIHFLTEYTLFYFAFLPIEAVFVTLVIDQMMEIRARKEKFEKLNMVVGVFFSEVGTRMLSEFSRGDPNIDTIKTDLLVGPTWSNEQFEKASKQLKNYAYKIDIKNIELITMRDFLTDKRNFLVRLLENPVLLDNESFTELLRAVFHLTEELEFRKDLTSLPANDYTHIKGDMERAYVRLVHAWLDYMRYVKNNYPYLYSLSMRTNPFDPNASPIVK